jgi:rhodanese-related sulfurtransferase
MFPDVESLSSEKLLHDTFSTEIFRTDDVKAHQWTIDGENALLVDVRTRPERNISMITGSIPLEEFNKNVLPKLVDLSPDDVVSQPNTIIFYCTIGYRSGMESRKLQNKYPFLFHQEWKAENHVKSETHNSNKKRQPKMQVKNLDGILNFANALEASEAERRMNLASSKGPNKHTTDGLLINPNTNKPTNRVHVYGPSWKHCLSARYDPVVFSKVEFGWRGLGVALRSIPCPSCSCMGGCRRYPWSKSQ